MGFLAVLLILFVIAVVVGIVIHFLWTLLIAAVVLLAIWMGVRFWRREDSH